MTKMTGEAVMCHIDYGPGEVRPLGIMESLYHHGALLSGSSVCHHVIVIESRRELTEDLVRDSFYYLAGFQEALSLKIVPDQNVTGNHLSYKFARMDDLRCEVAVIPLDRTRDWPQLMNLQTYTSPAFNFVEGPLWRLIFAPVLETSASGPGFDYVIIFTIHHAIADAVSAFDLLYRQFLPILSHFVKHGSAELFSIPRLPLPESPETFLPRDNITKYALWRQRRKLKMKGWCMNKCFDANDFQDTSDDTEETVDYPIIPFLFSKHLTDSIIESAKCNGVTVHSVLLVACSAAFSAVCKRTAFHRPRTIRLGWSIDLRRHLGMESPQALGAITSTGITCIRSVVDYTRKKFWKTCAQVYNDVKQKSLLDNCIKPLRLMANTVHAFKNEPMENILDHLDTNTHILLSNLGNCNNEAPPPILESSGIHLREYYRSITGMDNSPGIPYFFHAVATYNGRLSWTTTYNSWSVSSQFTQDVLEQTQIILNKFCTIDTNSERAETSTTIVSENTS